MKKVFPWLRYCENHWKASMIWQNCLALSNAIEEDARIKAAEKKAAAEGEVIDVDADDDVGQDGQEKPSNSKRPRIDGEASEPKRRRVQNDKPAPSPDPASTKATTK